MLNYCVGSFMRWKLLLSLLTAVGGFYGPVDAHNVAIIGAGAAGSSAAVYLRRFASDSNVPLNITVFEKSDRVGGRSLTVDVFNNSGYPVELGASLFIPRNYILYEAAMDYGLALEKPEFDDNGLLLFWDGQRAVFELDSASSRWAIVRLVRKYGLSPYRTYRLVNKVVNMFLKLYKEPYFPFESLTNRVHELGLANFSGFTGEEVFSEYNVDSAFARDILQAFTRVNYASNLACIHGVEALVSLATDGAVAIEGGNWKLFSRMLNESSASVLSNTAVASIQPVASASQSYTLTTRNQGNSGAASEDAEDAEYPVQFDSVIVATPWQFSDIATAPDVPLSSIPSIPYTRLHVTIFASPHPLSPAFFRRLPGQKAPTSVLTTLPAGEEGKCSPDAAGSTGFFSVTTRGKATNPHTQQIEYVYKIFSPNAVTAKFLSSLLGVPVPDDVTSSAHPVSGAAVTWFHTRVFNSYPVETPRTKFQDPVLGGGLYYTSGMESFISTMETSALMGKNVARLIVDALERGSSSRDGDDANQKGLGRGDQEL